MKKNILVAFFSFCFFGSFAQWEKAPKLSEGSFRSIDATQGARVWAGGSANTILTSTDNGKSWSKMNVGAAYKLDFRGIAALDEMKVVAVSAGLAEEGSAKIFLSEDGGKSWKMTFDSNEKGVFMDGVKFFNAKEGIVYGDPIDGRMFILKTVDGGRTWSRIGEKMPDLKEGEASFAASNSNIFVLDNTVWIATQDRIFRSKNRGTDWEVFSTFFPSGTTAGIFGMHFSSQSDGVILGGDYVNDKGKFPNIAFTQNGGKTWHKTQEIEPFGLKEAAWKIGIDQVLVIGTTGTSIAHLDSGKYEVLDSESFHALSCNSKYCFAIGGKGNLARMKIGD
ncbi:BNR/Asp-box repeat-containing protein [Spirosomataceae bacterium TFI 002]|nr:BNR/Asp-box repeat-containing protein [Spirosomataceae bacterium TFI 002]